MAKNPVWDFPTGSSTGSFLLALLALVDQRNGRMEWHSYVGYTLVVLVVTRFVWGFVGSFHSRFRNFVRGPGTVVTYLRGSSARLPGRAESPLTSSVSDSADATVGHNPLGAYSTLALLSVLLLQGVSGMFSIDDVAFDGPLAYYFEGNYIDLASQWHDIGWNVLQGLVTAPCGHCLVPAQEAPAVDPDHVVWIQAGRGQNIRLLVMVGQSWS